MQNIVKNFIRFMNENKFPHEIRSEKFWRHIVAGNKYAEEVLDTIMKEQGGKASDRQYAILKRVERGETDPYHSKN